VCEVFGNDAVRETNLALLVATTMTRSACARDTVHCDNRTDTVDVDHKPTCGYNCSRLLGWATRSIAPCQAPQCIPDRPQGMRRLPMLLCSFNDAPEGREAPARERP
jgi:hypothetical protein